jgi:hypothetical protein
VPSDYLTDLVAAPLSTDSYSRMSESPYVMQAVREEIAKRFGSDAGFTFQAAVYPSGDPQKPNLPIIGLNAVSAVPARAEAAARIWAEAVVRLQSDLDRGRNGAGVSVVLSDAAAMEESVREAEQAATAAQIEHDTLQNRLDQEAGVPLLTDQLKMAEAIDNELRGELTRVEKRANDSAERLMRTVSDLARTRSLDNNSGAAVATAPSSPVVSDLITRLVNEERSRRAALDSQVANLERQVQASRSNVERIRGALATATKKRAIQDLEGAARLAAIKERAQTIRAAYAKLAPRLTDARLASAQNWAVLKIAEASPPKARQSSPDLRLNVFAGAMAGLLLACAFIWISAGAALPR